MPSPSGKHNNRYFPPKDSKSIYQLLRKRHPEPSRVSLSLDRSLNRNKSTTRKTTYHRLIKSVPKRQDFPSLSFIVDKKSLLQTPENKRPRITSKQYFLKKPRDKPKCMDTSSIEPKKFKTEVQTLQPCQLTTITVLSSSEILRRYSQKLNNFQRSQIKYYEKVYFIGESVDKNRSGKTNWGFDDSEGSYLFKLHDHLAYRYQILSKLGEGSFGQVLKCRDHKEKKDVAIKIIKNRKRYTSQAIIQMNLLNHLKQATDGSANRHIVEVLHSFMFRQHQCIVFELLSANLFQLLKNNGYEGIPVDLIRRFALQILTGVAIIHLNGIIHCDIKPENILLRQAERSGLKIIDFGSSCKFNQRIYSYLQSRYYRAPQVIIGTDYNQKIDIWSLGCVFAELYLGYPLFPGKDENDQMRVIVSVMGHPPRRFIQKSSNSKINWEEQSLKKQNSLEKLIFDVGLRSFIKKCLIWDPSQRASIIDLVEDPWLVDCLPNEVRLQHSHYIKEIQLKTFKRNTFRGHNF